MEIDFLSDYILENDYILLRPLKDEDFNYLMHFAINEPELWKYSLTQANSEENLQRYIQLALEGRAHQKEYPFIVFDKIKNKYVGSTRFYDIQKANSSLQLGFTWYGKQYQRTGINSHCKYLLLDFAFNTLGVHRVEFRADNDNLPSIAAMKRIGCIVEGVLRSNGLRTDGTRRDSIVLSILKEEWDQHIQSSLYEKCKPIVKY